MEQSIGFFLIDNGSPPSPVYRTIGFRLHALWKQGMLQPLRLYRVGLFLILLV